MKGACSIPKKKLIQLFIIIPIAALALLYGSGYLSQLFSNYRAWQEAGAVFGTSPAFPDTGFFPCLAAAFHFPYGLYGLGLCIGALALLILMVMRMGYSEGGEYDRQRNLVYSDKGTYRGKYYTLTDQRIPYRRDKTEDERFFILTLFAIAHEIEAMGQYSGSLMRVQLAVGLPPAHFGVQAKRFINYFNGRGAVAFQFKGKPYAIFIENTACFPQSFSAAAATVKNLASFPRALVVDIGGFTADYVRLRNGVPDMAACDSLENGVILLYNRICAKANAELDILLEESEIDRILRGEDQDAAPEVIALAEREAQEFINDLLSGLRERMLELKSGKVIFLGGGATLLRRQIEASGKIGQAIFVEDINANAKGYEYLYRLQHSGR